MTRSTPALVREPRADAPRLRWAERRHVDELVALHYRCFSPADHWIMRLGRGFMRRVYRWFVESDRVVCMVADNDGRVVGSLVGTRGAYPLVVFANNKLATVRALLVRPWLALHPALLRRACGFLFSSGELEELLNSDDTVLHGSLVAIHPAYRRRGYTSTMIAEMYEELRRRGWCKIVSVAYRDNVASIRVMERMGFCEVPMSTSHPSSVVILRKDLEPARGGPRQDRGGTGP